MKSILEALQPLGRALMLHPKVLIMDEPTAALTESDVEHLFASFACSRSAASRSSTSVTVWSRSSKWPTGSPCCVTGDT